MSDIPLIDLKADPFALFAAWMSDAEKSEPNDPNAMAVATATPDGRPSVRMLLLKGVDERGFVFYTNLESRKGRELLANPHVALLFHWKSLRRQIRIEGPVEAVSAAEADAYFASRSRMSRLGAIASDQSRPLDDRSTFEERLKAVDEKYGDGPIPRPANWSGFRVLPEAIEFWQDRPYRLHDRAVWTRDGNIHDGNGWNVTRLYP
ncbi:MAG: pyridoxamine 5'-phosphate oxidase [Gluconobacter potus]|uniref:Pyridoxine/pyridoxamine 5'-phosphate oxidase n=1 Tax=Gluconobacter potus TaxID=2724927 RepID=A0ABR9YL30_9PROT|nr:MULTISPECIES: pyridoxamine 5'-phosphate oxidase [Gluconobacter]MBF0864771.1 pyridoxamine 5'-phosphate oxidase [Gluconobacter sp. R71656]MBF0866835.1 pyridoxamine 5'-phosphate oxidase [Gluconobacter sp. R75628]MBF0873288.1 pyridoxamine 5'-phosphate oxidase [Gluconobacter sp. R75629]MBF0882511.1 pyridoxamine 5'-phosphate oxidase [Gluconobacter potus]